MTLTNTYSLNVDIKKRMTSIVPTFSQGDSAVLKFRVYDNGKLMDMSDYTHSEVMFRQPSGRTLTGDADLVNGEIVYTFTGLEMAEIGKLETILSVSSGSSTVSIQPFYCFIFDNMRSNNLEYIGILQELIKEVQGLELGVGGLLNDFNSFDYSPSTTYDFPNLITYDGSTYIALKAVTGITPIDDKINYRVVAKRGDDSEEISNHKNNASPQKHINVVSSIPNDISNMGILVKVDGTQADVPSMITVDEINKNITQKVQAANLAYKESYATLSALQNAYPTGNQYNHVVLADGMIYTWSNNAWVNTQIQGNGTGIPPNSVPPKATTFLKFDSSKNLYDGNFVRKQVNGSVPDMRLLSVGTNRLAVVPVEPNTTYSIIKETSNRFKIATDTILNRPNNQVLNGSIQVTSTGSITNFRITTGLSDVVLYVDYSSADEDILVQIVKGTQTTFTVEDYTYTPSSNLNVYAKEEVDSKVEEVDSKVDETNTRLDFLEVTPKQVTFLKPENLYDGATFVRKTLSGSTPSMVFLNSANDKTAVIKIKPNTIYTVLRKPSSRFKIATDTIANRPNNQVLQGSLQVTITGSSSVYRHTFTSGANDEYLFVNYTSTDEDVLIQVTEGNISDFTVESYATLFSPTPELNIYSKEEVDVKLGQSSANRDILVKKIGANLHIYVPTGENRYVYYPYLYVNAPLYNLRQWRVPHVAIVDEQLNTLYQFTTGDWEGVITETGAADAIGGYHGDENNIDISFMLDGKVIDINGADFTRYAKNEVRIVNHSTLNRCDTPNDNVVTRYRVNIFNKEETIVDNKFIFLQNMTLDRITLTMFAGDYEYNGQPFINKGRNNGNYKIYSLPAESVPIRTDVTEMEIWGIESGVYVRAKADGYNFGTNYAQSLSDFGDRIKIYFRIYQNQTIASGTIIKGRSIYNIYA